MNEVKLKEMVAAARARYDAMSPAEKAAHDQAQRESFTRGQIGMGSDSDEAEWRAAQASGDPACIAAATNAQAERMARFERVIRKEGDA
jgi:hypothetical protein